MKTHAFTIVILLVAVAQAQDKASTPQPDPPPLSPNCQAKLELTEEVSRLLIKAASHSTQSSACIDGPGQRVAVDQVLVCPARTQADVVTVDATYQITRWAEGDTRMCGQSQNRPRPRLPGEGSETKEDPRHPDLCSGTPGITRHRMRFRFLRKGKAYVIDVPEKIDGFSGVHHGMTPLGKVHKGGCYGESGPFKPARILLRR